MPHRNQKKNKRRANARKEEQLRETVRQNALDKIKRIDKKDEDDSDRHSLTTGVKEQIDEVEEKGATSKRHVEALKDTLDKDKNDESIHQSDSDTEEPERPDNLVIQNIKSNFTQIGRTNIIANENADLSSSSSEEIEDASFTSGQDNQNKNSTYSSDVLKKKLLIQNIRANKVNIKILNTDWFENEGYSNPSHIESFLKNVSYFDTGHFVLVTDRITGVNSLEAFALVDWILVLDFDPESNSSGLLSYVNEGIAKKRALHYVSWQEEKYSYNSSSLYWVGMKGCPSQPDTRTSEIYREWNHQVKSKLNHQLLQLKRFADEYTDLKIVVLWPQQSKNFKHFYAVIDELLGVFYPIKPIIVELESKRNKESEQALGMLDDCLKVTISLEEMCRIINISCKPLPLSTSSEYKLPTADTTNDPKIDDKNAQWLRENLDVLYLTNKTSEEYDADRYEKEKENFLKGGTLPWSWWYEVGPGRVDIQRDITKDLINYIKTRRVKLVKSGSITLYHNPGSGGTTLAQQVLWSLKEDVPCVQIKQRYSATINDITERIEFVSEKTRMPVLVLADGSDEQKLESVRRLLGCHCCIVLLYVKRYRKKIVADESNMSRGIFKLNGNISVKEAERLCFLYNDHCNDKQRGNLRSLVEEMKNGLSHSLFDFGFAMHGYKYNGIVSYVRGYLKLDTSDTDILLPWKKALGYLALVCYYGQSSLPFKILAKLVDPENAHTISKFTDFPDEMQQMMVLDSEDSKIYDLRVTHYYIAAEILNQILVFPKVIQRPVFPSLSENSKRHVTKFAIDFIKIAKKLNHGYRSTAITQVLTRTFILRDNKAVGENETEVTRSRQKFSQILEDVSSNRPYTERFDIYQALTDSFPSEAQFRAHLGRLYTHCKPDDMDTAERCFKEALEISESGFRDLATDDIPYSNRMELKNIYHMYGNMILIKVSLYTGKYMGDKPRRQSNVPFEELSAQLLPLVKQSAELFAKCREITPLGCEESHGYIGEIQVRLMFCNYVHLNSGYPKGVCQFAYDVVNDVSLFIDECIVAVDELFLLCLSNIELEKMDRHVIECKEWYSSLFQTTPGHYIHSEKEGVYFRRLEIAKVKMKYCTPETYGTLEFVNDVSDIHLIVTKLEKNFEDYEKNLPDQHVMKRSMDLDYREWLYAIRHNLFEENYSIEKVLQNVEVWHNLLHTPYSWFYLFVLKSLLGLGTKKTKGYQALLGDARTCKEEMLKRAKHVHKPKYPREWLGKPEINGIRRLLSGRRFFGQVEGRDIKGKDLEVHKGTICPPNDRPAAGYIDLDLGPENQISVKVFFVPARSEDGLKGSAYKNFRVEFVMCFSLLHGYEAFNVKLIGHVKCPKCQQNVEKRSCEKEVECPRCHVIVKVQKVSTGKNGSQKK